MAEILKLELNKPTPISLKYRSGKELSGQYGPQVMFTLTDGRVLYLPPEAAAEIAALNPATGEQFVIVKTVQKGAPAAYRVERIPQSKTAKPASAAVPAPTPKEFYLARAKGLIDVFAAAQEYSVKTYNGSISKEDIRALVTTVYIQHTPKPGAR
jgi:outer membrane PBP1 activator LpoA protein